MLPPCFRDPELMRSLFEDRFHRPPPWFELAGEERLEEIAWELGRRLRMEPPTLDLTRACEAAWERMKPRASEQGAFHGWTEPLGDAVARLGVPTEGSVLLFRGGSEGAILRMRDLVEFESVLWWDDSWAVDEGCAWILAGRHDWPANWVRPQAVSLP
ncbi:MAG: hypothetical protein R3B68_15285 [Phycisphaerales bacterium]